MHTPPFSAKSRAELSLLEALVDRFVCEFASRDNPARVRALIHHAYQHAVGAVHQALTEAQHAPGSARTLLDAQQHIARLVVSAAGLNDSARASLRAHHFSQLLRDTPHFAHHPQPDAPTSLTTPPQPHTATAHCPFDPAAFRPLVVGSGRLASSFLAAFARLGVPPTHVTIVSRTKPTAHSPLARWLRTQLPPPDVADHIAAYAWHSLDDAPSSLPRHPGPVFLLLKRAAFADASRTDWLRALGARAVVNLMAGGALPGDHAPELCARANVLVGRPPGGTVVVCRADTQRDAWHAVQPVLRAVATVLLADDAALQSRLTFFTSTLPLVLLAEIDAACFANVPAPRVDRLVLQTWAERYRLAHALEAAEGASRAALLVPLPDALCRVVTQYMHTYFNNE